MKRKIQSKFALALAILFTIFTLPANGLAASAEDNGITPDKAYEVDYTIKHEDGINESVADGFFEKPGILLEEDRKSTRLNSSHVANSYAVFCLKKKRKSERKRKRQ